MNSRLLIIFQLSLRVAFILAVTILATATKAQAQGTVAYRFDGQPPGTAGSISSYSEGGMTFWNPYGPENLARIGPSLSGYPDNGTAYLAITLGAKLAFSFNTFPGTYFNFVSFDAANYGDNPPRTLQVIGYRGMAGTVTNYFTTDFSFQTFHLGPEFQLVSRVDVLTDRWSLDNLVISGVPEPAAGALVLLGSAVAFFGRRRVKRLRR